MAKRGRKALTPEQREQRQEAKLAQKAESLRAGALAKLPVEKERRNELFRELENLRKDAQGVSGSISAQKKRMHEVFGLTKEAMQIRGILAGCKDGVYEATVQQVALLLKDIDRPFQLDMFTGEPGTGVADDAGSVFDATDAGEAQAAERKVTAYYNEIDPYASRNGCRNLIAAGYHAGHIADLIAAGGETLTSATSATCEPDDLRGYTQCHFFAGIGGWSRRPPTCRMARRPTCLDRLLSLPALQRRRSGQGGR
jgi:hypothetical protein